MSFDRLPVTGYRVPASVARQIFVYKKAVKLCKIRPSHVALSIVSDWCRLSYNESSYSGFRSYNKIYWNLRETTTQYICSENLCRKIIKINRFSFHIVKKYLLHFFSGMKSSVKTEKLMDALVDRYINLNNLNTKIYLRLKTRHSFIFFKRRDVDMYIDTYVLLIINKYFFNTA